MNAAVDGPNAIAGYHLLEQLYCGSRTLVYRAIREADELPVVIKLLQKEYPSFSELLQFRNQYTIAKNLNLPGVVKPYSLEFYGHSYALVMEDFGGISLKDYVKTYSLELAEFLHIGIQLAGILHSLHRHRVIHKDIKPANILINPNNKEVKLIDFSIASLLPRETQEIQSPNILEGTLAYLSPEQTGRMNRGIDYRTDFYSLGIVFYELLSGELPFSSTDPMELVHCHIAKNPPSLQDIKSQKLKFKNEVIEEVVEAKYSHENPIKFLKEQPGNASPVPNAKGQTEEVVGEKHSHLSSSELLKELEVNASPNPIKAIEIPEVISSIVMKLMAKNAEERYQNALGLKYDLEQCLNQLQQIGTIETFEIAQRDICDRFIIPEKLYGREAEVQTLLDAFERVSAGSSEMMLVAGYSGIGKTAVVNEVHKPIVRQRGYFIKGKFDQFNRNIPFWAFLHAFRELVGQLLSETDAQLQQWKIKILAALGENGQVIIDVIPELEQIIGSQPAVSELSGNAAQNRFNLLFHKFIQVFTTQEHPLVIFLDDLQWADLASLKLMQLLMSDTGTNYLLLIGAYRDNEVWAAHPLLLTLEDIHKAQTPINTITLSFLLQTDLNNLVADTLNCSSEITEPLTQLVYQKTQGNPFFATQFLKSLYEEDLIIFNLDQGYWECDIAQLRAITLTEDVVEFMARQLQKLPPRVQAVLKLSACIGNEFDLATLSIVYEKSQAETATDLWRALQEGLILPISEVYKFFQANEQILEAIQPQSNPNPSSLIHPSLPTYKFLHDRVQQAAYFLIPEAQKQLTHLKIGQLLLKNTVIAELDEKLFEIVNQLNIGKPLIVEQTEQINLAQLNLKAGQKARASTAYAAAFDYFTTGIDLLSTQSWQTHYQLTLSLYEAALESAYLCGDFEQMADLAAIILEHTATILDRVKVYEVQIQAAQAQAQPLEAIQIALQILQQLGVTFPEQPTEQDIGQALQETFCLLAGRAPMDLISLPAMNDPQQIAIMGILAGVTASAYVAAPTLLPLIMLEQVKLSLQYGNSSFSPDGYCGCGIILCAMVGDIPAGYQFGQLALRLLEQLDTRKLKARTYGQVHCCISHWQEPLVNTLGFLREGYQSGLEVGDIEWGGICAVLYMMHAWFAGQELSDLNREGAAILSQLMQLKQETMSKQAGVFQQAFLNLLGTGDTEAWRLAGEAFDEAKHLSVFVQAGNYTGLCYFYVTQLVLSYLFGQIEPALAAASSLEKCLGAATGTSLIPVFYTYDSLSHLAIYTQVSEAEQPPILQRVSVNQDKIKNWANHGPVNQLHKFYLVEAERYRVLGNKAEAIEYYDLAITGAKEHGYLNEEALANELAAKFYLAWGKERMAQSYLIEAYYGYARWGAVAKVNDLERRYPELLASILHQKNVQLSPEQTIHAGSTITSSYTISHHSASASSTGISAALDLATVLKASQTLSSEIQLEPLLSTLLQVVIENAGADQCVFLLIKDGELVVEAKMTLGQAPIIEPSIPLDATQDLPLTLINSVKRSLEPAVLIDASADPSLLGDPYIIREQPKSVLCMPVIHQGKLLGILYLENNLNTGTFTTDRVEILNLLCSQAAISLENARLYQRSQTYAQQVEQSLTQLRLSETRFQKLADNIPGVIYRICVLPDGSVSIPYVSSGCYNLYGVPAEEIVAGQRSLRDLEHPEDRERITQAMVESAQNLTPFRQEWRIVTPTGQIKWVQAASQPERHADGSLVWDGLMLDITERKQIEAEQSRLLAILENTSDLIGTADLAGRNLYLNQAWRNLMNFDSEIDITETLIPQYHPDWAVEIIENQAIPEAIRSGIWVGETAVLNREGREILVSQVVLAHKSKDGELEYFSTIIRDISDVKAAEAALQTSQKNLRTIFDNANNAVFIHEIDGTLLDVNNRMLEMYGMPSREQALKLLALDYSAPDNPFDQVPELWNRTLAGETVCIEWKCQRPLDQSVFDGEITLSKIILNGYEVVLASVQDISQRKAAEAALRQKSQELEKTLQELKTMQLQLVQNEKMSALGNLVAGVAHEINNPVSFIAGNIGPAKDYIKDLFGLIDLFQEKFPNGDLEIEDEIEAIELDYLREDLPKLIESMKLGVDRIRNISTSLRTFSRSDTDYKVPFNIHEGIDSTILILKHRLKANEERPAIDVIKEYGNLPTVECFPGQLNQVFMNILANAIDAIEESNIGHSFQQIQASRNFIKIQTKFIRAGESQSFTKDAVIIQMIDNGAGMTDEVKQHIFEHLFTTKSVGKGTGLGLAIAHQIVVEKHGGTLEVNSTPGEGSTFIISLPVNG
jgi:PAS domain S-box-containing protein